MFIILAHIAVLVLIVLTAWWLSWYDPKVMGVNDRNDLVRRSLRCGATLILAEAGIWSMWQFVRYENTVGGELYLGISIMLAILWSGCLTALLSRAFEWLVHPHNELEWEFDRSLRDLDTLAKLVRNGRRKEAIQLCLKLKKSGDASVLALETILDHLGVKDQFVRKPEPLTQASRLRREGKFAAAESLLKSLLSKNPTNVDAAMMLIRLYAQELRRPDKAEKVLRALERQPYVSDGHTDFARRSIAEWSRNKTDPEVPPAPPSSVDELIAKRHLGIAVERLLQRTEEQPLDFESWLKLAEVYAVHCDSIRRAETIVRQIEEDSAFTQEQIQMARTRLNEWRELERQRD